jgi:hypothetical protein
MWWGTLQHSQCSDDGIIYPEGYNIVHYKYTDIKDAEFHKFRHFLKYIEPSVKAVLFIFGIIGNVIVLAIIVCNKEMWTVPNMYIINLVVIDLTVLVANFPLYQVYSTVNTIKEMSPDDITLPCMFFKFLHRFSVGLSAYLVALLSYQRYNVTVNPLHFYVHSPVTWRVTAAVWIVAAIFALPSALSVGNGIDTHCDMYSRYMYYKQVVLLDLYVFCILLVCVIVFFYVMTARHLVKSAHTLFQEIHPLAINIKIQQKLYCGLALFCNKLCTLPHYMGVFYIGTIC